VFAILQNNTNKNFNTGVIILTPEDNSLHKNASYEVSFVKISPLVFLHSLSF